MPLEGDYTGIGVAPRVSGAFAETARRVRVVFSEPMQASVELQDAASYTITPDMGSDARTVDAVALEPNTPFPTYVLLFLDGDLTIGVDNYQVAVVDTVTDVAGNTLDPLFDTADFSGIHTSPVVDHCALALDRLRQQYRGRPKMEALICKLADQATEVEQAAEDILAFRAIGTGFGAQLDKLGENLNTPREGLSDADYRVVLAAKVKVLASKGHPDELLDILVTLDNGFAPSSISLSEQPPAAVVLTCDVPSGGQLIGERFARMLREAKPAAVKFELDFQEQGITLFSWAEVVGSDPAPPANSGWDEDGTGTNSGRWTEASGGIND